MNNDEQPGRDDADDEELMHEDSTGDVFEDEDLEAFSDDGDEDESGDDDSDEGILNLESLPKGPTERVRSMVEDFFGDEIEEVMDELDVLTLEDVAAYLKVEYGQIRRLIKEQGLPGRKIGEEWRFLRGAIADWLRGGETPAQAARPTEEFEERQRPPLRERFSGGESRPPRKQGGGGNYQGGEGGPRRQRYESRPENEYQPPRRPRGPGAGGQGGYRGGQAGGYGGQGGGQGGGYPGGQGGGPRKNKRKSMNEQRFKRLDRRKFDGGAAGPEGGE